MPTPEEILANYRASKQTGAERQAGSYLDRIDQATRPVQGVLRSGVEWVGNTLDAAHKYAIRKPLSALYNVEGDTMDEFVQGMKGVAKQEPEDEDILDRAYYAPARNISRLATVGREVGGRAANALDAYKKNVGALAGGASAALSGDLDIAQARLSQFDPTSGARALIESPDENTQRAAESFVVGAATDPVQLVSGGLGVAGKAISKTPGAARVRGYLDDRALKMGASRKARAISGLESVQASEDAIKIFGEAKAAGISTERMEEIVRHYFDPNFKIRGKFRNDQGKRVPLPKELVAQQFEQQGGGLLTPYMGPITPEQYRYNKLMLKATGANPDLNLVSGRLTEQEQVFADSLENWFSRRHKNMQDAGVNIGSEVNPLSRKYISRELKAKSTEDLVQTLQLHLGKHRGLPGKSTILKPRKGNIPLGSTKAEELAGVFDPADIIDSYNWQAQRASAMARTVDYIKQNRGTLRRDDIAWVRDRFGSSKINDIVNTALRETGDLQNDRVLKWMKTSGGEALKAYQRFIDTMNQNVLQRSPAHHIGNYISDSTIIYQAGLNPKNIVDGGTELLKSGRASALFQEAIGDGLDVVNSGRSELLRADGMLADKLKFARGDSGIHLQDRFDSALNKIRDKTGLTLPLQRQVSEDWDATLKLGLWRHFKHELGMPGPQAVAEVFKILPEYGTDTHLFRAIKSVIPFLTWQWQMSYKVPMNMAKNPGRAMLLNRAQQAMLPEDEPPLNWRESHSFGQGPEELTILTKALSRALGGRPENGDAVLRLYLPIEAASLIPKVGEAAIAAGRGAFGNTSQAQTAKNALLGAVNATNPLVRGVAESVIGLDSFDQKPLEQIGPIPNLITNTASEVLPVLVPNTQLAQAAGNYVGKKVTGYDRIFGGIRQDLKADTINSLTEALLATFLGARVKVTGKSRRFQNAEVLRRRLYPDRKDKK